MTPSAPSPVGPLRGACRVPADKAISHRAAILAATAEGVSRIRGYSPAVDCRATLGVLRAIGISARERAGALEVASPASAARRAGHGAVETEPLDCGRSGTTMRLVAGLLASRPVRARLTGDPQLLRRPMERVAAPLRAMGAEVVTNGGRPPIDIEGGSLRGIDFTPPVASAQVKSAVLIAGLAAEGVTAVTEPRPTRDHTERLLARMGARISREDGRIEIERSTLHAVDLTIPGDVSSASFLLAAAALVPGSEVRIEGVGVNPTRLGFLRIMQRMGAEAEVSVERDPGDAPEPVGTITVRASSLEATTVDGDEATAAIDELPLIGLLATQAEGTTEVHGAEELRVKESDRIAGLAAGLRALGAAVEEFADGFAVTGPTPLTAGRCDPLGDHRLAMTFLVAGLVADCGVTVTGRARTDDSFPGFERTLRGLIAARSP